MASLTTMWSCAEVRRGWGLPPRWKRAIRMAPSIQPAFSQFSLKSVSGRVRKPMSAISQAATPSPNHGSIHSRASRSVAIRSTRASRIASATG